MRYDLLDICMIIFPITISIILIVIGLKFLEEKFNFKKKRIRATYKYLLLSSLIFNTILFVFITLLNINLIIGIEMITSILAVGVYKEAISKPKRPFYLVCYSLFYVIMLALPYLI